MPATAKLSARFQISIPKSVRSAQQWRAGQEFAFVPKGTGVLVVPVQDLDDLRGITRGADREGYRDREDRF